MSLVDTPVPKPASKADQVKSFLGDLARPFAIYVTSGAAAAATIRIAWNIDTGEAGAIFIGAVFAGVGALYGVRSWEKVKTEGHTAVVEKAKVEAGVPTSGQTTSNPIAARAVGVVGDADRNSSVGGADEDFAPSASRSR